MDSMSSEEEREYAENREEYLREFHRVIAPVAVIHRYEYEINHHGN